MEHPCHDLKSERGEVSPGLPSAFKVIPIAFYASILLSIGLSVWFYMGIRKAEEDLAKAEEKYSDLQVQKTVLTTRTAELAALNTRAEEVAEWVEGSTSLQPLIVGISRSVTERATIAEMNLARNAEIPFQIHLTLKLDGDTSGVLTQTDQVFDDLNFQTHGAEEKNTRGGLDYKATLVFEAPAIEF